MGDQGAAGVGPTVGFRRAGGRAASREIGAGAKAAAFAREDYRARAAFTGRHPGEGIREFLDHVDAGGVHRRRIRERDGRQIVGEGELDFRVGHLGSSRLDFERR